MLKKVLLATLVAASFGGMPLASFAQRTIVITEAPPAPRQEAVPGARRGFVWVPGHYEFRHRRYDWVAGHWMRERRGYAYREPHWVERNGRWYMEQGRWERGGHRMRDRDGDGVRNRSDRDRDGDGVPNRFDARPNNPNRN